jgi:hypothetical protein
VAGLRSCAPDGRTTARLVWRTRAQLLGDERPGNLWQNQSASERTRTTAVMFSLSGGDSGHYLLNEDSLHVCLFWVSDSSLFCDLFLRLNIWVLFGARTDTCRHTKRNPSSLGATFPSGQLSTDSLITPVSPLRLPNATPSSLFHLSPTGPPSNVLTAASQYRSCPIQLPNATASARKD